MRFPRSRPVWLAAMWAAIALFFTAQGALVHLAARSPLDREWDVLHPLVYWLTWAAASPVIVWAAERYRLERGAMAAALARHAVFMVAVPVVQTTAAFAVHWGVLRATGVVRVPGLLAWLDARGPSLLWWMLAGLLYYWLTVGVYYAFAYQRLYHEARLATARLEADVSSARLTALAAQLQPHFLFNTLNSISVLTQEDPPRARQVLLRLGDLLRASLDRQGRPEVPLAEELRLTDDYLEIQRVRFGERLGIRVDVEPAARTGMVPALVLQPLVENAIRHGVETRPEGGAIAIHARRAGATLRLSVSDDGPGLGPNGGPAREGVGLVTTRARLAQLYGDAQRLTLSGAPGGGCAVHIELPFRAAAAAAAGGEAACAS